MTLGNLGTKGYACSNGLVREDIYLVCAYGVIYNLISIGYGSPVTTCYNAVTVISIVEWEFTFRRRVKCV